MCLTAAADFFTDHIKLTAREFIAQIEVFLENRFPARLHGESFDDLVSFSFPDLNLQNQFCFLLLLHFGLMHPPYGYVEQASEA